MRTSLRCQSNGNHFRSQVSAIVALEDESEASVDYREQINAEGSPSERVAENYRWTPGTELRVV